MVGSIGAEAPLVLAATLIGDTRSAHRALVGRRWSSRLKISMRSPDVRSATSSPYTSLILDRMSGELHIIDADEVMEARQIGDQILSCFETQDIEHEILGDIVEPLDARRRREFNTSASSAADFKRLEMVNAPRRDVRYER